MEGKTDNELIAEFAGWQCDVINGVKIWYRVGVSRSTSPGELKFDSSWDWLMPVVEKIDGMGYHVTIMRTRTIIAITLNVQNHIQSIHPGYSMIEVCYQAVVEFIKWYNRQKEK